MRRWLPFALPAMLLLAMWLLLNRTLGAGEVILGAVLALGASYVLGGLQPQLSNLRRPHVAVVLAVLVFCDIVRSNIAVGRIVLHARALRHTPGFVDIPLDLRAPVALAVLACIITATPGTAWARYDPGRSVLTLHVLDLIDEAALVDIIKHRYERRLLEIFQ